MIQILTKAICAVLFDLDGTLIKTHIDFPAMRQAMRRIAQEAGVPPHLVESRDILSIVEVAQNELNRRGLSWRGIPARCVCSFGRNRGFGLFPA